MQTARFIVAAAIAGLLSAPAMAAPKKDPETRLAERLDGLVAGEPVKCIDLHHVRNTTIYDGTAIVFDAGSTIYVNRPKNGGKSMRDDDVMVTRTTTGRLCDVDVVQMHDSGGFWNGVVFLGDFVPYKKPSQD